MGINAENFDMFVMDMSPYIKENVDPKIFHHAAVAVCEKALATTRSHRQAKVYAAEMLEALGFKPIPDNLPLACGHARDCLRSDGKEKHCVKCKSDRERDRKRANDGGSRKVA